MGKRKGAQKPQPISGGLLDQHNVTSLAAHIASGANLTRANDLARQLLSVLQQELEAHTQWLALAVMLGNSIADVPDEDRSCYMAAIAVLARRIIKHGEPEYIGPHAPGHG